MSASGGLLVRLWIADYLMDERGYSRAESFEIADCVPGNASIPTRIAELLDHVELAVLAYETRRAA